MNEFGGGRREYKSFLPSVVVVWCLTGQWSWPAPSLPPAPAMETIHQQAPSCLTQQQFFMLFLFQRFSCAAARSPLSVSVLYGLCSSSSRFHDFY